MAGPSGLKLGVLIEGMGENVLAEEFFGSVNYAWPGRLSGIKFSKFTDFHVPVNKPANNRQMWVCNFAWDAIYHSK